MSFTKHVLKGVLEEDKPVYFPRGSLFDIAMKSSIRQDLQGVYRLAEKYNSYMDFKGSVFNFTYYFLFCKY
jgi:hypothetical protein